MSDKTWLTLRETADLLSVHPTTVRRWADAGELPTMRTPGGHRRFKRTDIERFVLTRKRGDRPKPEDMWAERALQTTRQSITAADAPRWLNRHDDDMRQQQRELGRRLLGLAMQYVAAGEQESPAYLAEAAAIGRAYAANSRAAQLTLPDALRAFLFFRDTLVETAVQLPANGGDRPTATRRLVRRLNELLNTVQLTIVDAYAER